MKQLLIAITWSSMSLTRVHHFSVSLDGFATGADQSFDAPFGHAGSRLLDWFGPTRLGRQVHGSDLPPDRGINDALVSAGVDGTIGAEIMGRRKFTPQTGPWADDGWRGWWGDEPPFHTPVFVLTHHPRPPLEMKGGTTFHFIDASPEDSLEGLEADYDIETVTSSASPVTHLIFQRRT